MKITPARPLGMWMLRGHRPAAIAACLVLAGAGFAWFEHRSWTAFEPQFTPSCSFPLRVRGQGTPEQAGLVRCYLQSLAGGDTIGLNALAALPDHITQADLTYSADARAGLATATFTPSTVDSTYVLLTITYADRARESTGLMNMVAMGGSSVWRLSRSRPG